MPIPASLSFCFDGVIKKTLQRNGFLRSGSRLDNRYRKTRERVLTPVEKAQRTGEATLRKTFRAFLRSCDTPLPFDNRLRPSSNGCAGG